MSWKDPLKLVARKLYSYKLLRGVDAIQRANLTDLKDRTFVANLIRQIGLRHEKRDRALNLYGNDSIYMNTYGPGLWQIPDQLAGALVHLSQYSIDSVLEIGTCDGWTSTVMAAYLQRFCPNLRFVTVDIAGRFTAHSKVNQKVRIEYSGASTVERYKDQCFDLVFIDGNHDYEWVKNDYLLAGNKARLCMFHDIVDAYVGDENVPKFWRDLKSSESSTSEFAEFQGIPANVMGIGIRNRT